VFSLVAAVAALGAVGATSRHDAAAALPAEGNMVQKWNELAQNAVLASGAFQNEGLIYMAYESAAVYDAVTSIEGGYEPYGPAMAAPENASVDAAVAEAAYRTLSASFPAQATTLDAAYDEALALVPDGPAKDAGKAVGLQAAEDLIALRAGDGRRPIGTIVPESPTPAPGVWQRTPPAFAAPQTPWVGAVRPFVLDAPDQFLSDRPPALASPEWASQFDEIKAWGRATGSPRTQEQTDIAVFWTTNVIRQYNTAFRELATGRVLNALETARLMAMGNIVGADAQIAVMNAKYHYWFWRPVTAITATDAATTDGNPATVEEPGWTPLAATPNHPEYPAAHGSLTSAMAEVFSEFLGTNRIDLTLRSTTVPTMPVRHFERVNDLRAEIVEARLWGGMHYRSSTEAGLVLGRKVAHYDLKHAFQPVREHGNAHNHDGGKGNGNGHDEGHDPGHGRGHHHTDE
jgi:hypothetical protein